MWQPTSTHDWYRALAITFALAVIGAGALMVAVTTADAQADVAVDQLNVSGVNRTIGGNVTDVVVSSTLSYETDVPDGERRIIRLEAGPTREDTELLAYTQQRTSGGPASGTVSLEGSLLDHGAYDAGSFQPPVAGSVSEEFVVVASIEVQRENGEVVTHRVVDSVRVVLRDDGSLVAVVGGSGDVTVETPA